MALIKCPECGKEVSDRANACIHCGYPIQPATQKNERSTHRYLKEEPQKEKKKILIIGIAVAFLIIAVLFIAVGRNSSEPVQVPHETVSNYDAMVLQSKENIQPYFDVMGTDITNGNPDVSQAFIDNLTSVELMGCVGSVEHGYNTYNGKTYIELLTWKSNDPVSAEDFENFIGRLNLYFNSTGKFTSQYHVSDEAWEWVDPDNKCSAISWYEDNHIYASWDWILPEAKETAFSSEQSGNDTSIIQQSKDNLKPYFDVLGIDTEDDGLAVSQEFLDNISAIELMGYSGSIEHGYSDITGNTIDIMEWVSNTEITGEDYENFIQSMNRYFGSEATLKSYDNLSEETYHWVDYDELCMAFCWNENGKVYMRWYLEEELVASMTKLSSESTTSVTTPRATEAKAACIECGKTANYTYTNPFSGVEESYCYSHYKEIIDIMSMMEDDVGNSSYSKHTCEECGREGTHRYESFTGQTEYYCTEHYEELKDMLEAFGLD